ncbi:hypothetical protein [Thiohalobacter thiocyanaticus]|uniref:Uncharacterized protein n=1 Tax=Thiohalobacter thiocyanaticus TaxID=585455 RepID=A0A426QI46_9GAMM|nr:hypothetical protein [Thiohalobacter thiocyanaticus]RRQ21420.1 hypothetical protein D6C00_05325 [Thiohalobacter thiocyanaticus]
MKVLISLFPVIPAQAGIQMSLRIMDSGLRRNDAERDCGYTGLGELYLSVLSVYSVAILI